MRSAFDRTSRSPRSRRASRRGLTLFEVMVAAAILALVGVGFLATLIQSRKMTEGSLYQSSANTIMQGYIEQIKNIEFSDLPYIKLDGTIQPGVVAGSPESILTRSVQRVTNAAGETENALDILKISTAKTIPEPKRIIQSGVPAGVNDNIKLFDINNTPDNPKDDLRLRVWIWVQDISNPSVDATQVLGITVIYAWRPNTDKEGQSFYGTIRTIRSSVPTF